jgi:hypothetical protein
MAFRPKFGRLMALKPDLAIIPECESRKFLAAEAAFTPRSAVWIGDNPRKGLGIFSFGDVRARLDAIHRPDIPYVVPLRVSGPIKLRRLGLTSACHAARGVAQGQEPEPTLYWRDRRRDGPIYHIDYCFIPKDWTARLAGVSVGGFDDWVGAGLSDHVPLTVEMTLSR